MTGRALYLMDVYTGNPLSKRLVRGVGDAVKNGRPRTYYGVRWKLIKSLGADDQTSLQKATLRVERY